MSRLVGATARWVAATPGILKVDQHHGSKLEDYSRRCRVDMMLSAKLPHANMKSTPRVVEWAHEDLPSFVPRRHSGFPLIAA
jgi:hypothetical protein